MRIRGFYELSLPKKVLVLFPYYAGLLPSEVLNLKWTDIYDFDKDRFREYFYITLGIKLSKRILPLHKDLVYWLEKLKAKEKEYFIPSGYVLNNKGNKLSRNWYNTVTKKIGVSFIDLRLDYIKWIMQQTSNVRLIQQLGGFKTLSYLFNYLESNGLLQSDSIDIILDREAPEVI